MNKLKQMLQSEEQNLHSVVDVSHLTSMVNNVIEGLYQENQSTMTPEAFLSTSQVSTPFNMLGNTYLDPAMKKQDLFTTPIKEITQSAIPQQLIDIVSTIDDLAFSFNSVEDTYKKIVGKANSPITKIDTTFMKSYNVENIRREFPVLQTEVRGKPLVWLDNAATTQKPQVVIDTIKKYYEQENSNIHRGNHFLSMQATEMYENVRKKVARFINANSENEIIFVRGATEGINLVAASFGKEFINRGDDIIVTTIEHHSNILPWQILCEEMGAKLCVVPIDKNGDILFEEYVKLLSNKTKLVAMAHVSNAIGTVLPIEAMTKIAHQYGAYVLIDGAQSAPHFRINVAALDCDFFVFSGHKLFGPTGIGIVYGKSALLEQLPPWQVGGGMIERVTFEKSTYAKSPYKFEAGTGSIASVAGLGSAIDYLSQVGMSHIVGYEQSLMKYARQKLSQVPGLTLIGNPLEGAGVVPFIMDGIDTNHIGSYLDQHGIALRVGHHCAQPALQFFGLESVVRPSFAFYNTHEEIDLLASVLHAIK